MGNDFRKEDGSFDEIEAMRHIMSKPGPCGSSARMGEAKQKFSEFLGIIEHCRKLAQTKDSS
jgi:hypothetical protein